MTSPETQRAVQWLAIVVVVGTLVAVTVMNRRVGTTFAATPAGEASISRYGFLLQEASAVLGVSFEHQEPTFDPQLAHIMPQVASMGAAVAVADFDRDGWQDFYVTNSDIGARNRLYRNNDDGTFTDVAVEQGVADVNTEGTGVSMGAVWGDYDNDGYEDLFLYKYGRPELFHNEQGKGFTRVSDRAGLPEWVNAGTAIWWDYDNDGHLDLFVAGYWSEQIDLWHLQTTRIMPESFEYANNGGRKYLFRNRGDGTFEETSEALGLTSNRWTLAAAAADVFGTGYPALLLANDYGISQLFENRGGKTFVEVGREAGVGRTPKSGMSATFGDVFNDGRLSIYKTNISEPGILVQGNDLWVPQAPPSPDARPVYEDMATVMGVRLGGWSWGAVFGDLNNDGWQDLFLANGYVSAADRRSYWYDFSQIAVGHTRIISDARNWPAMHGRSLSGYQRSHVWINDGAGRFLDVAPAVGVMDTFDGRAVAFADLSNTGTLDVLVANQRGPLLIYRNTVAPGRHWLGVALEGTVSNRSAIGASVTVYWNGRHQVQVVDGGTGFSAQGQRALHFGLGTSATVDRVVVRWPSGRVQTIEQPAVDRLMHVTEPAR
ncbi:MAG: CRTAC1 family protein [Acidobacteria bacterium]|nr:CRTAC1 family protein [Acidobacteriota bacterium]